MLNDQDYTPPIAGAGPRRWRLSLHLSERKLLLSVIDLFLVNVALVTVMGWRAGELFDPSVITAHPVWLASLSCVWIVVSFLLYAYDLRRAAHLGSGAALGAAAALSTAFLYLLIPRITPPFPTSRVLLVSFVGVTVALVVLWRCVYALLLVRPSFQKRVLVVGSVDGVKLITDVIRSHARREYSVGGFVSTEATEADSFEGIRVLGPRQDLVRLANLESASEVIVAINPNVLMDPPLQRALIRCHQQGLQVRDVAAFYEELTGAVAVAHIGSNLQAILPTSRYPTRLYWTVKWLFDMLMGVVGVVAAALLLPVVAVVQKIENPGPLFYRQVRVGRGGKQFTLLKFRTMIPDAEVEGPQWADEKDHRVTRMGKVLRRLHLDELPQAVNILRGDMSFIGPRPERPEFVAQLRQQIPFYEARCATRPGVTGWAQVNYRYGASAEDAMIKLQYDLYYIKHQSLLLDVVILVRTVGLILALRGR